MNKQGNGWVVFVVIVGIIVIAGIILALVFSNQGTKNVSTLPTKSIALYLRALESNTKIGIPGKYEIRNNSNNVLVGVSSSGDLLGDSFTLIENISENNINIFCSSDNHYSTLNNHTFTQEEINTNLSKYDCIINRIGRIEVKSDYTLQEGENTVPINVSSVGLIKHPTMCLAWTGGIQVVTKTDAQLICDKGNWINYSYYDEKKKEYTWLPNNDWKCGNWVEKCQSAYGSMCNILQVDVPPRYKNKVDKCFILTRELDNSYIMVDLYVKTEKLNSLDSISGYIYDDELIYDINLGQYIYASENNGGNLGTKKDALFSVK